MQSSYCFEQNGLFGAVARGLGFDVIDGAARVVQVRAVVPLLPRWRLMQLTTAAGRCSSMRCMPQCAQPQVSPAAASL